MADSTDVPSGAYQADREPERMQIVERAKALSEAGYPLQEDAPAMHADQRLQKAGQTADATQARKVGSYFWYDESTLSEKIAATLDRP